MKLISENTRIDFVGKMKFGVVFSSIVIVLGLLSFLIRGERNFGIDFTGGDLKQVEFSKDTSAEQLRASLKKSGAGDVVIQEVSGEKPTFIVRSSLDGKDAVTQGLTAVHGSTDSYSVEREEMVGPAVGKDLRKQGLFALFFSLLGILLYVSWRFEFRYALGAIAALFHDVVITVGVLSLCQIEISLQILAALLTIVGYSLNDTIVVFDRIRETNNLSKKETYPNVVNSSINQTLSRTLLTSLTTFLVVLMLFIFGGEVIHDFALALLVGIVIGTYSSIFVASALVLYWKPVSVGKK